MGVINRRAFIAWLLVVSVFSLVLLLGSQRSSAQTLELNTPTPTSETINTLPSGSMGDSSSWLELPALPITATQADRGAQIFQYVCQDCHGDEGQGLTDEWRAEWAPEDQNCWQSKCHASNHPVEGFVLPRYVPAIIGPDRLARFETARDLYDFIRDNMPWHAPGSLQDLEYMQLTAFLVRENEIAPMDSPLDAQRAADLDLHPGNTVDPESTGTSVSNNALTPILFWSLLGLLLVGASFILGVRWYKRS